MKHALGGAFKNTQTLETWQVTEKLRTKEMKLENQATPLVQAEISQQLFF